MATVRDLDFPVAALLDGTALWVEAARYDDGSLKNPASVLDYPHAPWWDRGGQSAPDSITGHLAKHGVCTSTLAEAARRWVQANLSLETVQTNEWLFYGLSRLRLFYERERLPGCGGVPPGHHRQAKAPENSVTCCSGLRPRRA